MADTDVRITATEREEFGKGASRRYRRDGLVPAVMYGSGSDVRHIVLPAHELNLALRIPQVVLNVELGGTTLIVAPRDLQRDPVRRDTLHVDLILLSDAEVASRHAYSDALARAEANAEEAGLDPLLAGAVISEAAENDEDLADVADRIVEILEEQAKAMREAAAAEAAKEDEAAAAAESAEGEEAAEGEESAEESD